MNRMEQERFIEKEMRGLWPQWQPTEAELRVWLSDLAALDYGVARTAAQACFRAQGANYQRPVLGRFLERARALSPPSSGAARIRRDPTTNVFIECSEPPEDRPCLLGVRKPVYVTPASKQSDPDYVMACAEHMRTCFEHLYGGHWIVLRLRPSEDDGLCRGPARAGLRNAPGSNTLPSNSPARSPSAPSGTGPTLGNALPPAFLYPATR